MKPAKFKEQTFELQAPTGMTDCDPLPVHRDPYYLISKWEFISWKERWRAFWQGHIWLWVVDPITQPPVSLTTDNPFKA